MSGRNRRRIDRVVLYAALLALVAFVIDRAGTALVVAVPLEHPEAILVLGSHEWERLPAAVEIARANPSALVFLTIPRVTTKYNCHDCEARPARLLAAGVSAERIVKLPDRVTNTRDEAAAARAECARRNVRRLVVVTSPYHSRRARHTFENAFEGTGVSLGFVPSAASPARPERWWAAAYDRAYVRYEWAAVTYYWLLGYER